MEENGCVKLTLNAKEQRKNMSIHVDLGLALILNKPINLSLSPKKNNQTNKHVRQKNITPVASTHTCTRLRKIQMILLILILSRN